MEFEMTNPFDDIKKDRKIIMDVDPIKHAESKARIEKAMEEFEWQRKVEEAEAIRVASETYLTF